MRWLWIILDKIYKNISKALTMIMFFFLAVIAIGFSAQYIGEKLAGRFLENKSVRYVLAYDKDNRFSNKLFTKIARNKILRQHNFKFFKTSKMGGLETRKDKFDVIVADNKEVIEEMIKEGIIAPYPPQIVPLKTKKYVRFSNYSEYIIARTNDNVDVYVAIASDLPAVEEAKVYKSLNIFGEEYYRKESTDPYFEDEFDEVLKKENEEKLKIIEKDKVEKQEKDKIKNMDKQIKK